MKTMKKFTTKITAVLALLVALSSSVAIAQSNVELGLYKEGTSIAKLKIDKLKKEEPVSITLKNEDGVVMFSDKSSSDKYVKMLDFANIKDGIYIIDIVQPKGLIRKSIVKENSSLVINSESYVLNNYISFHEDSKVLVKFNSTLNQPVTLRILDQDGNILHEEAGIKDSDYAAVFNMSKLSKGAYRMSLTSGEFTNSRQLSL